MIVVIYDRDFLASLVDRLLVMRSDGCAVFEVNYSFYVEQIEKQRKPGKPSNRKKTKGRDSLQRKRSSPSSYDRLSMDRLEELVVEHETALAELHDRFGDPTVYKNPEMLVELQEQTEKLKQELADVDAAWQERVDLQ